MFSKSFTSKTRILFSSNNVSLRSCHIFQEFSIEKRCFVILTSDLSSLKIRIVPIILVELQIQNHNIS